MMLHKRDKRLKACRYCHKKRAEVLFVPILDGIRWRVVCDKCGAFTSLCNTEVDAIGRWNDMFGEMNKDGLLDRHAEV